MPEIIWIITDPDTDEVWCEGYGWKQPPLLREEISVYDNFEDANKVAFTLAVCSRPRVNVACFEREMK